jgi:hypothetical protein
MITHCKKTLYILLLTLPLFVSCKDFLEPVNDNHTTFDRIISDPSYADGLLLNAYNAVPTNQMQYTDILTDDAVTNQKGHTFTTMATGGWSSIFDPISVWSGSLRSIMYINKFLTLVDSVQWKWTNLDINEMFKMRYKGEAYGLRALFKYNLLQSVGGYAEDGGKLGIPIYDEFIDLKGDFEVPRATFDESVKSIYSDIDKALSYLTMDDYKSLNNPAEMPENLRKYNVEDYNQVFGVYASQRIPGRFLKALKARVALLVASPAFNENNDTKLWENAANYAGTVLTTINGVQGLDPQGHLFFLENNIKKATPANDLPEIIWRTAKRKTLDRREVLNYPPLLSGEGFLNPTQNLVDIFPMRDGYPITHALSNFNPKSPWGGRDQRLTDYVVYDANKIRYPIRTYIGSGTSAKDSIATSTRTGYYLKKMIRLDVNAAPTSTAKDQDHFNVHMRYTELFLIYAEAANEAWGPDGSGSFSFSARDLIAAIRKRAGITQPDNYLASITSKEDMRELIRNERRIELCLEGFRFWDLRRWKLDLQEPAKGVNMRWKTGVGWDYEYVDVEPRNYNNSYMHYGPIPDSELRKNKKLVQNKGW